VEQLIELLQQIQDLAGAGIDALKGATEGGKEPGGGAPAGGPPDPNGPDGDEGGYKKGAPPA
jgi:hypothetical protein